MTSKPPKTSGRPKVAMLVVPPLPGERRKSSSLVVGVKQYRSKWWRISCMGQAKKCIAGECIHLDAMKATYKFMVPEPHREARRAATTA